MEHDRSKGSAAHMSWADAKEVLTDWRLYLHYVVYFSKSCPFSSLSLFAPSIVKGLGYSSLQAQLMTVPPCESQQKLCTLFFANYAQMRLLLW